MPRAPPIRPIADHLGLPLEKAALSIIHIANNNMVGALHSVLTEQGLDPRDFVLVAFGGAGPPHVSDLMTDASIPRGLVPEFSRPILGAWVSSWPMRASIGIGPCS